MASSYTLNTNSGYGTYGGRYLQLSCTQTKDVENNRSTISWTLTAVGGSAPYYSTGPTSVSINGTQVYSKSRVNWDERVFPAGPADNSVSGSLIVNHSSDGSKSISVSVSTAVYYGAASAQTYSGTWTLDTIPRASSITCSTANIGSNATITISRASSAFTHTLTYYFGGLTGTIATKTTSTSVAFALPTTFYAKVPNAKSGTGIIYCDTYNGSTRIGDTKSCSFTAKVDEATNKPTISPNIYDSNSATVGLTGDSSKFVKGYSNAAFSIGASAQNSATISSTSITCGTQTSTSASGTLTGVQSATFVVTATDSRGFSVSQTINKTLVNYVPITCVLEVNTITAAGATTLKLSGKCFNSTFGSRTNTIITEYRYKEENGNYSNWAAIVPTLNNNAYNASIGITGLDYHKAYTFQARASDLLITGGAPTPEVTKMSMPIFDWGKEDFNFNVITSLNRPSGDTYHNVTRTDTNRTVGFGVGSSGVNAGIWDYQLDDWMIKSDGTSVTIYGMADYVVEQGTKDNWTYRKWKSGKLEIWNKPYTTVGSWVKWGTVYDSGNYIQVTWPFTFAAEPTVNATLRITNAGGWLEVIGAASTTQSSKYHFCRPDNTTATTSTWGMDIYAYGNY